VNIGNTRSRMMASSAGGLNTGAKEDESITGRVWTGGFYHVTARSCLAGVLKVMTRLFI
jgi:hypothetical protein